MSHQNPKFDLLLGNSISKFCKQLEEQERISKKFSITESPVSLAIKLMQQKSSFSESFTAISALKAIIDPIDKFKNINAAQELWNAKFKNVFSPAWAQMDMFTKFHVQTAKMASILNPSIVDFIENNVRTSYVDNEAISTVEAVYLETFEQIKEDLHIDELQEITDKITNNPTWIEEFKILTNSFHQAYLSDEFTIAITDLINRRFNIKNTKIVGTIVTIIIILYFISDSISDNKQE